VFDSQLMLHDGTAITATVTPTSTTRASGSAVLDIGETAAKGIAAVLIVQNDLGAASDTLQVDIQESDTEGSGYVEIARFGLLTRGTGMPGTYSLNFSTQKRYVRALITAVDASGSDFTVTGVYVLLTPQFFVRAG
jgi:hypothetical protein